jgi:hypothetical protein
VYNQFFAGYLRLHDNFGRGENKAMKILKKINTEVINVA